MYCQHCGCGDQEKDTYCRQCGEFLPDIEKSQRKRGIRTPADQFRLSLIFNLLSAAAGIGMAIALIIVHAGVEDTHPVIYAATSLLTVIGIWQIVSFFNNLNLRRRFVRKDSENESAQSISAKPTAELLPEADMSDIVPTSIVEGTTRQLKVPVSADTKKQTD